MAETCLQYSQAVDDSFRKVTKKDVTDIVERLEQILSFGFKIAEQADPEFIHRVPELVHLNLSLRCLQLPVLEKKLIGGTLLIMKVLQVKKTMEALAAVAPQKWLNQERLVEWIDKNHVFNLFFGGSLHPEVIKKSFYLLNFMYISGRIGETQLA